MSKRLSKEASCYRCKAYENILKIWIEKNQSLKISKSKSQKCQSEAEGKYVVVVVVAVVVVVVVEGKDVLDWISF